MTSSAHPVLSVVVRRFDHDVADQVEDITGKIQRAVSRQSGFIRQQDSFLSRDDGYELVTVFSFATREDLEKWEKSSIRLQLIDELDALSSDKLTHTKFDGLALLASPKESIRKIEVVVILIFWILVMGRLLGLVADLVLPENFVSFGRDVLLITLNVLLISYILLPWSSTRLARLKSRLSGSARSG